MNYSWDVKWRRISHPSLELKAIAVVLIPLSFPISILNMRYNPVKSRFLFILKGTSTRKFFDAIGIRRHSKSPHSVTVGGPSTNVTDSDGFLPGRTCFSSVLSNESDDALVSSEMAGDQANQIAVMKHTSSSSGRLPSIDDLGSDLTSKQSAWPTFYSVPLSELVSREIWIEGERILPDLDRQGHVLISEAMYKRWQSQFEEG